MKKIKISLSIIICGVVFSSMLMASAKQDEVLIDEGTQTEKVTDVLKLEQQRLRQSFPERIAKKIENLCFSRKNKALMPQDIQNAADEVAKEVCASSGFVATLEKATAMQMLMKIKFYIVRDGINGGVFFDKKFGFESNDSQILSEIEKQGGLQFVCYHHDIQGNGPCPDQLVFKWHDEKHKG